MASPLLRLTSVSAVQLGRTGRPAGFFDSPVRQKSLAAFGNFVRSPCEQWKWFRGYHTTALLKLLFHKPLAECVSPDTAIFGQGMLLHWATLGSKNTRSGQKQFPEEVASALISAFFQMGTTKRVPMFR